MRKILSICLLLFAVMAQAQIQDPVRFKSEFKHLSVDKAEIVFTATIDEGWHVYSTDLGDGGPISATFNIDKISGAIAVGKLQAKGKEIASYDKLFEMNVRYFEKAAQFVQELKLSGGDYQVQGYLEYGACNDENMPGRLRKWSSTSRVRQKQRVRMLRHLPINRRLLWQERHLPNRQKYRRMQSLRMGLMKG